MEFVKRYPWPGNVRQLYNALVQAAVMADGEILNRQDLVAAIGGVRNDLDLNVLEQPLGDGFNLEEHLKTIQRHYLRRGMEEARGNKTQAARLLGLPLSGTRRPARPAEVEYPDGPLSLSVVSASRLFGMALL